MPIICFFVLLFPVKTTFSQLITIILSPQAICGVYPTLCLPLNLFAIITAKRPKTNPLHPQHNNICYYLLVLMNK